MLSDYEKSLTAISNHILQYRELHHESISDFAKSCNLPEDTILSLEQKTLDVKLSVLKSISIHLKLSVSELLNYK